MCEEKLRENEVLRSDKDALSKRVHIFLENEYGYLHSTATRASSVKEKEEEDVEEGGTKRGRRTMHVNDISVLLIFNFCL